MPKTGRPRERFRLSPSTLEKLQKVLSIRGGISQETVDRVVNEWCDREIESLEQSAKYRSKE